MHGTPPLRGPHRLRLASLTCLLALGLLALAAPAAAEPVVEPTDSESAAPALNSPLSDSSADALGSTWNTTAAPDAGSEGTPGHGPEHRDEAAPPGAPAECRLLRDGVVRVDEEVCGVSPEGSSYDTELAGDGVHQLEARLTDRSGVGPTASSTYVRDTEEPLAPAVAGPPADAGSDGAPVWTWASEPGTTTTCTLTRGSTVVLAGPCISPLAVPLSQDGAHVLSVTAVDAAGNASAPGTASHVVDTTAPERPAVVGPSSPSRSTTPVLGLDAEPGALVECRLADGSPGGAVLTSTAWQPCPEAPLQVGAGPAAIYLLEVRATDPAGNTSAVTTFSYAYDPGAPDGLVDLALPRTPDSTRTPHWSWTPPAGGTASCTLTGPQGVLERRPCSPGFRPSAPLTADGRHVLTVAFAEGAEVATHSLLFVLDTTGPDAPTVTPSDTTGQRGQVPWGWAQEPATSWECQLERAGQVLTAFRACSPGTQLLGQWGHGAYVLSVRGVDLVGNRGAVGQASYTWMSAGPAAFGVTTASPTRGGTGPVRWSFLVPPDAAAVTCGVRRAGVLVRGPVECRDGYLMDLTGQRDGVYEVLVRFTDAAGNRTDQVRAYSLAPAVAGVRSAGAGVPGTPAALTGPRSHASASVEVLSGTVAAPVPVGAAVPAPVFEGTLREQLIPRAGAGAGAGTGAGAEAGGDTASTSTREAAVGRPRHAEEMLAAGAAEALRDVATETIRRPQLPIALVLLVLAFLLVQNRIDRRDPKLAGARIDADEELEFLAWTSPTPSTTAASAHPSGSPAGGAPA